jgi:4-hydroxy-3-methylbut-2-enyl diphosphate reductase
VSPAPLAQIVLAGPRGFCAGVERAIEIVEQALEVVGVPIYVRREIVHNRHVVEALREGRRLRGRSSTQVPEGATVIFAPRGSSPPCESATTCASA